jgi:hypothetical protein
MSAEEFMLWAKLSEVDPWDEHLDFGLGTVAAAIGNYAGKARPPSEPWLQPSDMMPLPRSKENEKEPDPTTFFNAVAKTQNANSINRH